MNDPSSRKATLRWGAEQLSKNWLRLVAHIGALTPLAILLWKFAVRRSLFAPAQQILTATGRTALILLILSLACTPMSVIFGLRRILRIRAPLGLYAFGYLTLHLATFVGWDYGFDLTLILRDLPYQPYVLVGLVTLLLLLPLAATSSRNWQKRLGKNWRRLHRLVYLAVLLDIVHFLWLSKDPSRPLRYGAIVLLLLLLRIKPVRQAAVKRRQNVGSRLHGSSP